MKNQIITTGMVLARTDFQEADRIVTILTPDQGKLRVIAKGVRRQRSKLAGGIELFSISELTVLPGRGELGTLISSRLQKHYRHIVKDIQRTMLGYEFLKRMHRLTEDAAGQEYFEVLIAAFEGLDDPDIQIDIVELWFSVQLLKITGHTPNLKTTDNGVQLEVTKKYTFDYDFMGFREDETGNYDANHIKLLRLSYGTESPVILKQVTNVATSAPETNKLASNILKQHVRI